MEPVSLRAAAVAGVAWTLLQKTGVRLAGLLTFVVLSRLLSPQDFGLVALASVFVGVVAVLTDAGFGTYLVQTHDRDPLIASTAFWTSLLFGTALSAATFALAPSLEGLLDADGLTPVLRALSVSFILVALAGTQTALLRRDLAFRGLAQRALVATAVSSVVAVVLAINGAGVWALVAQTLVQSVVGLAILWTASPWRPSWAWSRPHAGRMLRFGASVITVQLVGQARSRGDELIVGAALGVPALGVYAVAKKLLLVVTDLSTSVISTVVTPVLARVKTDPARLRSVFVRAVLGSSVLVGLVMFGLALFSPTFVPAIFGSQWEEAGRVAAVLGVGGPLVAAAYFDRAMYYAVGRGGTELRLTTAAAVSHLLVVALAAPFGLVAVAVAQILRLLLFLPVRLLTLQRATGVRSGPLLLSLLRVWLSAGLASGLGFAVLNGAPGSTGLRTAMAVVVYLLAYCLTVRFIARPGVDQLVEILPPRLRGAWFVRRLFGVVR